MIIAQIDSGGAKAALEAWGKLGEDEKEASGG
jgi:hypothetical protein